MNLGRNQTTERSNNTFHKQSQIHIMMVTELNISLLDPIRLADKRLWFVDARIMLLIWVIWERNPVHPFLTKASRLRGPKHPLFSQLPCLRPRDKAIAPIICVWIVVFTRADISSVSAASIFKPRLHQRLSDIINRSLRLRFNLVITV